MLATLRQKFFIGDTEFCKDFRLERIHTRDHCVTSSVLWQPSYQENWGLA